MQIRLVLLLLLLVTRFSLSSVRVRESPKRKHSVVSVCPYAPMRMREKGEKEKEEEKAAGLACNLASHKAIAS